MVVLVVLSVVAVVALHVLLPLPGPPKQPPRPPKHTPGLKNIWVAHYRLSASLWEKQAKTVLETFDLTTIKATKERQGKKVRQGLYLLASARLVWLSRACLSVPTVPPTL